MKKQPFLFLIGGIFSLMIAMGIGRFTYTPVLPLMQKTIGFSDATAGYLATSNYAGYLVGAFITSLVPLNNNRTFLLRLSLIISISTTAIMGLSHSFIFWFILRFISGVASAFVFVLASSIVLDKLAARNKTNWSGFFYSGVGFGIFTTGLFTPALNRFFQWEGVWVGLGIVAAILTLFVWILLVDYPNNIEKTNKQVVRNQVPPAKWLPWLVAAYGLEGLGYIVTGTFIVSFAEKMLPTSSAATFIWMIVGLAAIPSCAIWSLIGKRWGLIKSLIFAMVLQSLGIALPVLWMSATSLVISAALFGATFMGITTLATTIARQMNLSNTSRLIGYMTAVYAIGQMIGPTIAGVLSSVTHSFNSALIGAAAVVFLGACLLINGIKFEKKTAQEVEWENVQSNSN